MKDSLASDNVDEFSSVLADLEEPSLLLASTQKTPVLPSDITSTPAKTAPSYQAYKWDLLNRVLDIVDEKTNGRAGWLQRFISYLFFGGLAALVNLAVFYIMYYHILASLVLKNETLGNTLSYIVAAELSIIAN